MWLRGVFMFTLILSLFYFTGAANSALLVHNSAEEIDACSGRLKLELVRIWGGEDEEDDNKFFNTPISVSIFQNKLLFICDQYAHCIKVFSTTGEYLQTISQRGRGPGDTYRPTSIALSPEGNLVVLESGGCRIQRFDLNGKSLGIIKTDISTRWINVTSKDNLLVYNPQKTFDSRQLIYFYDHNGHVIRTIGKYHDKSNNYFESDKLFFAIDHSDNIYAARKCAPVIRKYSSKGTLLLAITFALPFEIPPVVISLNQPKNEIEILESDSNRNQGEIKQNNKNITIQSVKKKGRRRVRVVEAIGTDSQERIYIVSRRRLLTEKENLATAISGTANGVIRERVDYDIIDNIDAFRLLVFNPNGRIIANTQLTTFCDGIYIFGNRIFIIDGLLNQRVLEYKIRFED